MLHIVTNVVAVRVTGERQYPDELGACKQLGADKHTRMGQAKEGEHDSTGQLVSTHGAFSAVL